jgi:hypothetical protein
LDHAFVDAGQLSEDELSMNVPFEPTGLPNLGNRKVSVIERQPGSPVVLAGAEGALLRSGDNGKTFAYAFQYPDDGYYPYVGRILFPTSSPNLVLIRGFDKNDPYFYLGIGSKDGEKWNDLSYLLKNIESGVVTDLAEDQNGRLIAVGRRYCPPHRLGFPGAGAQAALFPIDTRGSFAVLPQERVTTQ